MCLSVRVELFVVCSMKLRYEKSNIYCEIVVKEKTVKFTHSSVNTMTECVIQCVVLFQYRYIVELKIHIRWYSFGG